MFLHAIPPAQQGKPYDDEDSGDGEQRHVEHTAEEAEHGEPGGDEEAQVLLVASRLADWRVEAKILAHLLSLSFQITQDIRPLVCHIFCD